MARTGSRPAGAPNRVRTRPTFVTAAIPKLVHYVWVGGSPLPKRFRDNVQSWRRHNPDYEIVAWNESNIDWSNAFLKEARRQKAWAKLSDLVRLIAVAEHGGIYLDTDVEACRSFDDLLASQCFFGCQSHREGDEPICNAVFGAVPNHWFIRQLIETFPAVTDRDLNKVGTGPELVSALLRQEGLPHEIDSRVQVADIDVYPPTWFYPYHWNEQFSRSVIKAETMMIHHWDMSWHHSDSSSPLRMIQRQLKSYPSLYRLAIKLYKGFR